MAHSVQFHRKILKESEMLSQQVELPAPFEL